ncbi:hypothetical protein [Verrucomicrobium spinosum]|uniref:hypothetical protein n=1 Tax=Verrucomicrobium spinosum TaxID=2736 RepID=UPI0009461AA7|nr:hypothetical protein [Verrucomicrobium spinosum]
MTTRLDPKFTTLLTDTAAKLETLEIWPRVLTDEVPVLQEKAVDLARQLREFATTLVQAQEAKISADLAAKVAALQAKEEEAAAREAEKARLLAEKEAARIAKEEAAAAAAAEKARLAAEREAAKAQAAAEKEAEKARIQAEKEAAKLAKEQAIAELLAERASSKRRKRPNGSPKSRLPPRWPQSGRAASRK